MRGLVGREPEFASMRELLHRVEADRQGALAQLAGEPGIGKSRLMHELAALARDRGWLVLEGRAAQFEDEVPFAVFRDAIDDWLRGLRPERLGELAASVGADIAAVFDVFGALVPRGEPEIQEERFRAHQAVRRLLSALAADRPLVLLLDDVHWADAGSSEVLRYLSTHPPRGAVLVAVAFRQPWLAEPLALALASAVRDQRAVRIDLTPLSRAAAGELLAGEIPAELHDRCYRHSGGNPFLLLEIARATAGDAVPATLEAALASELASTSVAAKLMLEGGAVIGDPFDSAMAAVAAGLSEAESAAALDELLHLELVGSTAVAGRFAFRHPVIRSAVYEGTRHAWRIHAHRRAAAALARAGAGPVERAPHIHLSADRGDLDAVELLSSAAKASERMAPAIAARWYSAALHLLPDQPEFGETRIELTVALASAYAGAGLLSESQSALAAVLDLLPAAAPTRPGIVAAYASVQNLLGRHRAADAQLLSAYRAAPRGAPAALLALELAATAGFENRPSEMLEWAQRALEGTERAEMRPAHAAAAGQVALAHYFLGLPADEAIARAATELDTLDDAALASRLDLGLWVGWTEAVLERHEQAIAHCRRVIEVSRRSGRGGTLLVTTTAQAWAELRAGRLAAADATLRATSEIGRLAPHLFFASALGLMAQLNTARGDLRAALQAGEECVELARAAEPGLIPGMAGLYMAVPLIELGEARAARDVILRMSAGDPALHTSRSGHAQAFEILTRAEVALGNLDAAKSWARRAQAATHGSQLAGEATYAHRATATVALARGDAERAAEVALAAANSAPHTPIEAARCRIVAGRALARGGQRRLALETLEDAAQALADRGAHGFLAEAERELRRVGRRGTRRTAQRSGDLTALTDREREIAEGAGRGLTNRQIAAAMFLSEKTVERHLTRVFSKLGVPNRAALARMLSAAGESGAAEPGAAV